MISKERHQSLTTSTSTTGVLLRHVTSPRALETILTDRRFIAYSGSLWNANAGANFYNERTTMGRQCLALYGATLLCRWTGPVRVVGPNPLPPFCGDALLDMNPWKLMVPCGSSPEHLSVVGFSLRK